jgi:hypothetical protein
MALQVQHQLEAVGEQHDVSREGLKRKFSFSQFYENFDSFKGKRTRQLEQCTTVVLLQNCNYFARY